MKVRYTITNVQFIPGAATAEVQVRAKVGESNLEHQNFTLPLDVATSRLDVLSAAVDAVLSERCGFPSDTVFECIAFSQRAGLGL